MESKAFIQDYTDKSFVVRGDTIKINHKLKDMGGRFNKFLKEKDSDDRFAGWIFSMNKKEVISVLVDDWKNESLISQDKKNLNIFDNLVIYMIQENNLEYLKKIHEDGYKFKIGNVIDNLVHCNIDTYKWFYSIGIPFNNSEIFRCALIIIRYEKQTELLEWLLEIGCPFSDDLPTIPANSNRLDLLQWLRKNGCPWNKDLPDTCAQFLSFETLKWSIENDCPYNMDSIIKCMLVGHFHYDIDLSANREKKIENLQIQILSFLKSIGCKSVDVSKIKGWLKSSKNVGRILKYLYEHHDEYLFDYDIMKSIKYKTTSKQKSDIESFKYNLEAACSFRSRYGKLWQWSSGSGELHINPNIKNYIDKNV
jgi:hypothetical protein